MTKPQPSSYIVLDRIEPGEPEPPYCIHGRATCVAGCGEWCWLGHASHDMVKSGQALPICRPCAIRYAPPDAKVTRRVTDHLRADGPHG